MSDEFTKLAGANAEGVISVFPWNPDRKDLKLEAFRERFRKRYGEEPETYAAHGYDGMNMLIWATQNAGLNRAKIRDVLAYRSDPWPGVTGDIPFSAALDDDATLRDHHDARCVDDGMSRGRLHATHVLDARNGGG